MNLFLNPLSPILYGIIFCILYSILEPYIKSFTKYISKRIGRRGGIVEPEYLEYKVSHIDFDTFIHQEIVEERLIEDPKYLKNVVLEGIARELARYIIQHADITIRPNEHCEYGFDKCAVRGEIKIERKNGTFKDLRDEY